MASAELVALLDEGVAQWNEEVAAHPGVRDLSAADLSGKDLVGINFAGVLLDGADLRGTVLRHANLRNARMVAADLSGADLENAAIGNLRLWRATLNGATFARVEGASVDFTDATLENVDFSSSRLSRATFSRTTLRDVSFAEARITEPVISSCSFEACNCYRAILSEGRISSTCISDSLFVECDLSSTVIDNSTLTNSSFEKSSLRSVRFSDCKYQGVEMKYADLTAAVLVRPSLDDLNLSNATLFDTQIISPQWEFDSVRADLGGAPVFAVNLFEHPVQDVKGLPSDLRRRIADAQIVKEHWEQSRSNRFRRLVMRTWGITSSYGQSMTRWSSMTLLFVLLCALGATHLDFYIPVSTIIEKAPVQGSTPYSPKAVEVSQTVTLQEPSFFRSLCFCLVMFTTLGFSDMTPASPTGQTLVVVLVVSGYMFLGALISVLATKFARLS